MLGKCCLRVRLFIFNLILNFIMTLYFQVRRIINNLRQLERIAEQSEDLDNVRIFHYCVELMIEYEKKTSKQVKELVKRLNKKTR